MALTILDGSIGQELVKRSNEEPTGLWSTEVLIRTPNLVLDVHADYFAAGADLAHAAAGTDDAVAQEVID